MLSASRIEGPKDCTNNPDWSKSRTPLYKQMQAALQEALLENQLLRERVVELEARLAQTLWAQQQAHAPQPNSRRCRSLTRL